MILIYKNNMIGMQFKITRKVIRLFPKEKQAILKSCLNIKGTVSHREIFHHKRRKLVSRFTPEKTDQTRNSRALQLTTRKTI